MKLLIEKINKDFTTNLMAFHKEATVTLANKFEFKLQFSEFFFLENAGELRFIVLRRLKPGYRAPLQHTPQLGYWITFAPVQIMIYEKMTILKSPKLFTLL
jgi:hypothetical protein